MTYWKQEIFNFSEFCNSLPQNNSFSWLHWLMILKQPWIIMWRGGFLQNFNQTLKRCTLSPKFSQTLPLKIWRKLHGRSSWILKPSASTDECCSIRLNVVSGTFGVPVATVPSDTSFPIETTSLRPTARPMELWLQPEMTSQMQVTINVELDYRCR